MPSSRPPRIPWVERYVTFLHRRAHFVVLTAAIIVTVAIVFASRLNLKTSFAELLPSKDPGVVELKRLQERVGSLESLVVAVQSPSKEANLAMAERVTEKMRALPKEMVEIVRYEARQERAFFERHKWLYVELGDLEGLRDWLRNQLLRTKNPLFIPFDEGLSPDQLRSRLSDRQHQTTPLELHEGNFMTADGRFVAIVAVPPGGLFGDAGDRLYAEASKIVDELRAQGLPPEMTLGLTGDIASQIEERRALRSDLAGVTALVILLVGIAVFLFYRRVRSLPLMVMPALCGGAVAFAIAQLAFGYLNASTAFLGSIIIGNGVNYAIIQLARYEEERRAGHGATRAGVVAVVGTIRATALAAGAASIAYGSLMLTRFRGFSQFGLIGGVGMILAWIATVSLLPSVLYLLDRKRAPKRKRAEAPGTRLVAPIARLATTRPLTLLAVGGALTVASLALLPRYLDDPFEYDFRNLRTERSRGRVFHSRVDEIFGRALSPTLIVVDDPGDAPLLEPAIRGKDKSLPGEPVIDLVVDVQDLLPGPRPTQIEKIAVLGELRALMEDRLFALLDEDEKRELLAYKPPANLRPIGIEDLPPLVLRPFRERDGKVGRVVLVFPMQHGFSSWNGRDLMRMAEVVGEIPLPNGHVVRSSGHAVVFASMIRAILHDAPIATAASFAGVALLVALLARGRRGTGAVLAVLLVGVVWMIGAAAAANERVNFLNFIALPITFGVGVDYGVNIYLRYRLEGRGRVGAAVRGTGGAVVLCSLTTIIGYGSLLIANNRALRSFGAMAVLGEIATLMAALLILPAYLVISERRRTRVREETAPAH